MQITHMMISRNFVLLFRKFFFDLDEDTSKEPETGVDALELAQQSEASLNNLLELEDKDDELLLQWEENRGKQGTLDGTQCRNFRNF